MEENGAEWKGKVIGPDGTGWDWRGSERTGADGTGRERPSERRGGEWNGPEWKGPNGQMNNNDFEMQMRTQRPGQISRETHAGPQPACERKKFHNSKVAVHRLW